MKHRGKERIHEIMTPSDGKDNLDRIEKLRNYLFEKYHVPDELVDDAKQQIALLWLVHRHRRYGVDLAALDFAEWLDSQRLIREFEIGGTVLHSYEHRIINERIRGKRKYRR